MTRPSTVAQKYRAPWGEKTDGEKKEERAFKLEKWFLEDTLHILYTFFIFYYVSLFAL